MLADVDEVLYQADLDGRWTYLNPAWERLFGIPVAAALGQPYQKTMHPDDRAASLLSLARVVTGDAEQCRTLRRMLHADGHAITVEISARLLHADDGTAVGVTGTIVDVTGRMQSIEVAERERRRLLHVLDGSQVGVWEHREDTSEAWYSPGWAEILGYTPSELSHDHTEFSDRVHPDDRAAHAAAAKRLLTGEIDYFEIEMRMRHKLGHWVWVRTRGRVMEWADDGGPLITAGTHADVTEQVTAREALRTAQKIDAIARVAGGVAHDFNNLLNVIISSADLLAAQGDAHPADAAAGAAASTRPVAAIHAAAHRAAALTRRLLEITEQREGATSVVDINAAVREFDLIVARALTPSVALEYRLADGELPVELDRGLFADVVLNLAINAADAMPDGGVLTIATATGTDPDTGAAQVRLAVSDTGTGIEPDVQARLFEPFFSTKAHGTGLGLPLASAFARQAGGTIDVASVVGAGTTFTFAFPRSTRAVASEQATAVTAPNAGHGEHVLVVDDEGLLRELARMQLEAAGYKVSTAADAAEAKVTLDAQPSIRLVFSDVVMPGGISGLALAADIGRRHPGVQVLLTTGFADDPRRDGYHGPLLPKPYTRAALLTAVRTTLDA